MTGYAVLDLETTGFSATRDDRVLEVAVVLLDAKGVVEQEWCTLLDPGRDLGAEERRGIPRADVALAPSFAEVAPWLVRLLGGRVLVGHNVGFDVRFLQAELDRAGTTLRLDPEHCLCTMRLARDRLPGASRGLAVCCELAGVPYDGAQSALGDARASAGLLRHYLDAGTLDRADTAGAVPVEQVDGLDVPEPRAAHRGDSGSLHHWLATLADRLPRVSEPPHADEYLDLLDQALLDRALSAQHRGSLLAAAQEAGLDLADVDDLHRAYLGSIARAALVDAAAGGRGLTAIEAAELRDIAGALGLGDDDLTVALAPPGTPIQRPLIGLEEGDRVVFTDDLSRPRDEWHGLAREAGLVPWSHVTQDTRLLVASDPDALCGKVRTARRHGIPVLTEHAFAGMLAQAPEA
ncbi:exonuclease domain-containing protein [Cellulomonas timonensis]|uniref:exonuclease domain-containing protein n=1 Tax=Cellulomonas timonensis TaxID=1689271 RepID=UPI000ACC422B|nr:exonuclease domain-containing protein [Cellulomonas timonensis]